MTLQSIKVNFAIQVGFQGECASGLASLPLLLGNGDRYALAAP